MREIAVILKPFTVSSRGPSRRGVKDELLVFLENDGEEDSVHCDCEVHTQIPLHSIADAYLVWRLIAVYMTLSYHYQLIHYIGPDI